MSEIVITKKINAGFLAIVLIIGIFAAISPSFIDVEASGDKRDNYKHKDNRHDKSKSVIVKKFVCNQNNIDVGGIGIDLQRDITSTLTEGQAQGKANQELSVNSMENGEKRNHGENNLGHKQLDNKDVVFICINNNISPEPPVEECTEAEADDIEACFEENLLPRDFELLTNALENGITVEIEGNFVSLNSFADICAALKGVTTWNQLFLALLNIAEELSDPTTPVAISNELVDCIAEALGIPLPQPPIPDTEAPNVLSFTAEPFRVSFSGGGTITITAHVTDATGVQRVGVFVQDECGGSPGFFQSFELSRISGTSTGGTYQASFTFPESALNVNHFCNTNLAFQIGGIVSDILGNGRGLPLTGVILEP